MIPGVASLEAKLKERITDPQKQLIVAALAADLTTVLALALTDPVKAEKEFAMIKASTANLTAAEASAVQMIFTQWLNGLVFGLISGVLKP